MKTARLFPVLLMGTVLLTALSSTAPAAVLLPQHRPAAIVPGSAAPAPDASALAAPAPAPKAEEEKPAETAPQQAEPVALERDVDKKTTEKISPAGESDDKSLPAKDPEESYDLPDYAVGARISTGKMQTYNIGEEDTLLDVARFFNLGFVEIRSANPDIDPWTPLPGEEVVIPTFHLLPRARQEGIVVNLSEMRMYYFRVPGQVPESFPIGIGREGLETPVGQTTILRKTAGPVWHPTDRMREEKPWLPEAIGPGPDNPLGTHALYLGWPTFLIHGSNKPWAIGRRVSSGCMRLYPEDIIRVFNEVPVGTKVTVVDQPILAGWVDDGFYLEANPTREQSYKIETGEDFDIKDLTPQMKDFITKAAGSAARNIDWVLAEKVVRERRGYPVLIARAGAEPKSSDSRNKPTTAHYN